MDLNTNVDAIMDKRADVGMDEQMGGQVKDRKSKFYIASCLSRCNKKKKKKKKNTYHIYVVGKY